MVKCRTAGTSALCVCKAVLALGVLFHKFFLPNTNTISYFTKPCFSFEVERYPDTIANLGTAYMSEQSLLKYYPFLVYKIWMCTHIHPHFTYIGSVCIYTYIYIQTNTEISKKLQSPNFCPKFRFCKTKHRTQHRTKGPISVRIHVAASCAVWYFTRTNMKTNACPPISLDPHLKPCFSRPLTRVFNMMTLIMPQLN